MDNNLKTYRVEDNGSMTPMVNVWMTMEQYSWWLEKKAEMAATKAPLEAPLTNRASTGKRNGSPHKSHAKPHSPATWVGRSGKNSMSAHRMDEFLASYEAHDGNLQKVARDLNIQANSASCYKSIAVYNGLIEPNNMTQMSIRTASTGPKRKKKGPIGMAKAQIVADLYEQYGDDDKAVADTLGVTTTSAKIYKSFARKVGFLR